VNRPHYIADFYLLATRMADLTRLTGDVTPSTVRGYEISCTGCSSQRAAAVIESGTRLSQR